MKPAEYWRRRSEEVAARQFAKADAYQAELDREYARATEEIRRAIEVFYQRYAANSEVSMAEARRQLSGKELRQFKMTLEEFTAKAKDNADGRWTKQLNEVYYRVRVSRYEALLTEIQQQVEMLAGSRQQRTGELLGDVYEDTYYRTIYELQRGTGFGVTFAKIDRDTLETVLGTEFAGSNWSKRIWNDRDKLVTELRTKLAQAFIRGEPAERTVRDLAERMGVSLSNAERLVQTETAFFVGEATAAGYKESGVVQKYEYLATLDNRTTQICRSMDGRVFALSEREVGVNYPPLHVRCRSTVVPYFDDEIDHGERIARDERGDTYFVPGDITYERWYNMHVGEQGATKTDFVASVKAIYNDWDKQDVKEFAQNVLIKAGSTLKVQRHRIPAHGQCQLNTSGETIEVITYELNSDDARSIEYQVKTVFHELFHAMANGLRHDIKEIGFQTWAYYDDVFAESFAHYMAKQVGITNEISPSYPGHLIETLPKLKALPEFERADNISDFGKIAYEYRLGVKKTAEWKKLIGEIGSRSFDISAYSQPYLGYIKENVAELVDKMLENMPNYKDYRTQMINDVNSAIAKGVKGLTGNEKIVFENVLIIAMNRIGVNAL
ncbi:minor capsid protein [Thermicanus aegyptius]|uniref:minor capsid protein n=1 Tax=Thermicanus aegyptius TaxID=94009 RepID=UPI0003F99137|nr:minor capsid protein [Thermicanus aegyptius]